jgi:hypothetical protein
MWVALIAPARRRKKAQALESAKSTDHDSPMYMPSKFIARGQECYYRRLSTNQDTPCGQSVLACSLV